jgi:hypothetical protein
VDHEVVYLSIPAVALGLMVNSTPPHFYCVSTFRGAAMLSLDPDSFELPDDVRLDRLGGCNINRAASAISLS